MSTDLLNKANPGDQMPLELIFLFPTQVTLSVREDYWAPSLQSPTKTKCYCYGINNYLNFLEHSYLQPWPTTLESYVSKDKLNCF